MFTACHAAVASSGVESRVPDYHATHIPHRATRASRARDFDFAADDDGEDDDNGRDDDDNPRATI